MKLPLSKPRTRRSPSGYAVVTSSPSWRTRSAISFSVNATRSTSRPSRRGSITNSLACVVHHSALVADGGLTRFHSGDPYHVVAAQHYGPTGPQRTNNSRFGEKPLHSSLTTLQVSCEAIPSMPLPYNRFRRLWNVNSPRVRRSEEHTSELQSRLHLECRLL